MALFSANVPHADNVNTVGTYACWLREYFDLYPQYNLYQFNLSTCPQEPPELEESAETCEHRHKTVGRPYFVLVHFAFLRVVVYQL